MKKYKALKQNRLPFSWCPGCGINVIATYLAEFLEKNNYTNRDTSIISGIGCAGRFAGYFNMDTMHTTHGRAVCIAEGLKLNKPDLNVLVVSGDGDLLGIGLNHLIHTARRNTNIKVLCLNNSIYAMTGGQLSPTTPKGWKTQTSQKGNIYKSINAVDIVCKPFKRFFARVTPLHKELFLQALDKAYSHDGFSFIEIVLPCFENDHRRNGVKSPGKALEYVSSEFINVGQVKNLKINQVGIISTYANKR